MRGTSFQHRTSLLRKDKSDMNYDGPGVAATGEANIRYCIRLRQLQAAWLWYAATMDCCLLIFESCLRVFQTHKEKTLGSKSTSRENCDNLEDSQLNRWERTVRSTYQNAIDIVRLRCKGHQTSSRR